MVEEAMILRTDKCVECGERAPTDRSKMPWTCECGRLFIPKPKPRGVRKQPA